MDPIIVNSKKAAELVSSNEVITVMEHGDQTTKFAGIVVTKFPLEKTTTGAQCFRFILTNNSKRIMIIILEKDIINAHINKIRLHSVIQIENALTLKYNGRNDESLVRFKVLIQDKSSIDLIGYFDSFIPLMIGAKDLDNLDRVELFIGKKIRINGYIKYPFKKVDKVIGVISNYNTDIPVHIKEINKYNIFELEKGTFVSVCGIVAKMSDYISSTIILEARLENIFINDTKPRQNY